MNIAFLRLFLYEQTNRTMTSEFNSAMHSLIGDIFFRYKRSCQKGCDMMEFVLI